MESRGDHEDADRTRGLARDATEMPSSGGPWHTPQERQKVWDLSPQTRRAYSVTNPGFRRLKPYILGAILKKKNQI